MRGSYFHKFGFFAVTIADSQRGLLFCDGRFERFLEPGRVRVFDPTQKYSVEVFDVVQQECATERALILQRQHPQLAAQHLEVVRTDPTQVAIVSLDGVPHAVVMPNETRAFWKTLTKVDVELINADENYRATPKQLAQLSKLQVRQLDVFDIPSFQVGLLFDNGNFVEQLAPGKYGFWSVGRQIKVRFFTLRREAVEVTAQEILTKDRVGIRVTLTAFYRIEDPVKAHAAVDDISTTLYRFIQFAIREAVAARTLDEILAARDTLDAQVRAYVQERASELGVEVGDVGVKDVILPGDVRELLNKVVEAERNAKANLIRRQEETAATRSLLNTSKLMQDNPLLLRLKELEALEKLVEKVGRIDVRAGENGGGALESLLSDLYRLRNDKDGQSDR
ncbi:MAG: slipin family protein [Pseudomonadota bacterium]